MTSSDRFLVPVRSAVKSNLTDWCFQNLSKRALNVNKSNISKHKKTFYPSVLITDNMFYNIVKNDH